MDKRLEQLRDKNDEKLELIRKTVETRLESLQKDNAEKLEKMRSTVDEKLQSTLEKRLSESFKMVSERLELVHKGLGEMQNLASDVSDFKRVLTNVKTRGTWGEVQLESLLEQVFIKDHYDKQVRVNPKSSEVVDFAIKLPDKSSERGFIYLPIDAKFPLEKYTQIIQSETAHQTANLKKDFIAQIKKHMSDISSKYILPTYGTVDFSLMYIPSEAIYYEVVTSDELMSYSREQRVYPVSPNTFYAHLQVLLLSFQGKEMEKQTQQILQILQAVSKEHAILMEELTVLGKHVNNAYNSVNTVRQTAMMVGSKLSETRMLK